MSKLAEYTSLLKEEYKKCRDVREKERYQALYLVASGYTCKEAAFIVCKHEETISLWIDKWLEEKSVKDDPREGRPETITKEMKESMTKLVEDNDPSNGKANCIIVDCWYLKNHLKETYAVEVSNEAIRLHLLSLGYHYAKSEYEFTKKDAQKRKEYLQGILPLFKNNEIDLNFTDEARVKLHPKPGYFWTKNPRPIVKTACSHKGITVKGVVNPITGESFCKTYDKNNRESHLLFIQEFVSLKRPLVESGKIKQVFLSMDNLSIHKVKEVMEFVSNIPWLIMNFQPTYSPDLNVIEWLWGFLRRKKLNGQVFASIEEMKQKLDEIFRGLTPEIIRKTCSVAILEKQALKIGVI